MMLCKASRNFRTTLCFLIVLLPLIISVGCSTKEPLDGLIQVEVEVPIEEQLTSPGEQKRILPWDQLVMSERSSYSLDTVRSYQENGLSIGLATAKAQLSARDKAISSIRDRLYQLPAAEPAPGNIDRPDVEAFIETNPAARRVVEDHLRDQWESRIQHDGATHQVIVSLSLNRIAQAILESGGGFSETDTIAKELNARSRARKEALDRATQELLEKALNKQIDGIALNTWAQAKPDASERLMEALRDAQMISSSQTTTKTGRNVWRTRMEVDISPLLEEARADLKDARNQQENEVIN